MYIAVVSLKWNENNSQRIAEQVGISLYSFALKMLTINFCKYFFLLLL
jgi:hypothetical protein